MADIDFQALDIEKWPFLSEMECVWAENIPKLKTQTVVWRASNKFDRDEHKYTNDRTLSKTIYQRFDRVANKAEFVNPPYKNRPISEPYSMRVYSDYAGYRFYVKAN